GITVVTGLVLPHMMLTVFAALAVAGLVGLVLAILTERGASRRRIRERSTLVRGTAALSAAADELRANGTAPVALARLDQAGGGPSGAAGGCGGGVRGGGAHRAGARPRGRARRGGAAASRAPSGRARGPPAWAAAS